MSSRKFWAKKNFQKTIKFRQKSIFVNKNLWFLAKKSQKEFVSNLTPEVTAGSSVIG